MADAGVELALRKTGGRPTSARSLIEARVTPTSGDARAPKPSAVRYITPEAILDMRFGDRERPCWDIAVLCFRGRRGSNLLVQKLGARPVGVKTLYALEEAAGLGDG